MKKILCFILAALTVTALLASCTAKEEGSVVSSSSAADTYAAWLEDRIGDARGITVGLDTDASAYGVDLSGFENDGYVIKTLGDDTVILGKTADGLDRAVRKFAKLYAAGEVTDVIYHEGYRVKELRLFGVPADEFVIEYPADHNENMVFAASELARLVKKACGAVIPVHEGITDAPHAIEFRFSGNKGFSTEGYRYFEENGRLIIEGAYERGCSNAVYRFLENECGWERLFYGDSSLRTADLIDVPAGIDKTEIPAFDYFRPYTYMNEPGGVPYQNERGGATAAQNSYGWIMEACHGMQNNDWAEIGAEKLWSTQPCLTDEDTYELIRDNIAYYLEVHKSEIGKSLRDVDIAQADNGNHCYCRECQKVYKEEGGVSGAWVRFANRLSEELCETYPGVVYKIFAYEATKQAPKMTRPNDMVYVTYCLDRNCSAHPINAENCENEAYCRQIKEWTDICPNVYIWYYALPEYLNQYTVVDTAYENFKQLADFKVRGMFLEEEHDVFDFNRVMNVVLYELVWNIDMTREEYDALVDSVFASEYGEGWTYIREYEHMLAESQEDNVCFTCWHCWWNEPPVERQNNGYIVDQFDTMYALLDRAIYEADNALHEKRASILLCPAIWQGCGFTYYKADEARMAVLNERFDRMISILDKYSLDSNPCFNHPPYLRASGDKTALERNIEAYWSGCEAQLKK